MKKKICRLFLGIAMVVTLAGCAKAENNTMLTPTQAPVETAKPTQIVEPTETPTPEPTATSTPEPTATPTPSPTPTEIPHEHVYTESISKEMTCTEAGEKNFTCECGDTYAETIEATGHNYEVVENSAVSATCTSDGKEADTKCSLCGDTITGEVISAIGHSYGEYVYNEDATFSKDGTKTSTCANCGDEKTKTATGTKKNYTYTELDRVMYITKTTNARSLPSKDGKKKEELRETKAVKVTGKCNETGWYRIIYNNAERYVDGSCISATRPDASTAVVWDNHIRPTAEQISKYTFTEVNKVLYATFQKSIWTLPNGNFDPFGQADENSNQMGFLVTFYPVKITGICNETGWYRIDVNGYTGYLSVSAGGAGDVSFLEELPKCDKPDLGYEIGSKEWHAYWDGYTYGQFYYATAQHLNLSVEEAHYFADYPFDYVIGSYANIEVTGLGTAEFKGEY